MADLIIAQLLDEQLTLIDSFSFRDRSALAGWLTRTELRPGDRITFKEGGRARAAIDVSRIAVDGDGERTVIPFPPPKEA